MFAGGSAGSTAGGIKVGRIWMSVKVMGQELERAFRPSVVRPLKVSGVSISGTLKLSVVSYVLGIILLFALGAVLVMAFEPAKANCGFTTAATASLACLGNIGPGLGKVGPVENYAWMTDATKGLLTVLMLLGRLEVFAVLVLFLPRFWQTT